MAEDGQRELKDAELVSGAQNGDKDFFSELVKRYYKPLFGYIFIRMRDYYATEDIVQEAFFRAYCSLSNCRKPSGFTGWLFKIGRNCQSEWMRDRSKFRRIPEGIDVPKFDEYKPQILNILGMIKDLPEQYYLVLSLKYFKGMSCAEISEKLEQPIGTVTSNLARAYKLLKKELNKNDL
ncbi:MAG: sigma-70 family RNA polymerase sigma factor [Planctomycetes bacterium]|nr:sigma-70 family RNA polymerase sigma factor [Planctomycetota bacterium]